MSKARIYARNLVANWIGYGANLVVMFFLSPFVVHHLGNTTYGVWSLIMSLTGYLGLIEMGMRGGLGRFINFHLGRDDIPKVNGVINTALMFFLLCGFPLFIVAGGLGAFFGNLFTKVPAELIGSARLAVMLVALNLWLSFFSAAFKQILTAFERFDLTNAVNIGVLAVRAGGTVAVLLRGGGIVGLAAVQVVSSLIGTLAVFVLAKRNFPKLQLHPRLASKARFRELFGFGVWAFIGGIGMRLLYWTDLIVITVLLGPTMVTFYAVPLMLIQHSRGLVSQISRVLVPQTIRASSVHDFEELRFIFSWGSKIIMFLAIPLFVGMMFFGTEFIRLWMPWSEAESRLSGNVLILLAIPQLLVVALWPGGGIISGLGYVKFGALMTLLQAIINLGLTLLFVMVMGLGLYGVALGTLVPSIAFNVVIAGFILRWIRFPVGKFVWDNVLRWCTMIIAFGIICYGVFQILGNGRWLAFGLKVVALAAVSLPLGWYIIFKGSEQRILRERIMGIFSQVSA